MEVIICDTSILRRNTLSHTEFRNLIKLWLKDNYLNTSHLNIEKGLTIFIKKIFIEKAISKFGDVKAHALTNIPAIIKNAIFINSEDDKRGRPDILQVLKFETLIEVEGIRYVAWLYVRQTKSQFQLYSINLKA